MTKKRQIKFTLIRTLVAISIALLVAALLIFISAGGSTFAEKLNATKEALKQMLIGPLFRMSEKKGTSFEAKRFTEILAAMIPTTFTGLSVCIMFAANQFNMGAEGGIMLGAFVSAMAAISGRLLRSRSPPHPKRQTSSLSGQMARSVSSTFSRASGVWA